MKAASASQGTDAVQAGVSYTLANNVENLTLTGTDDIDGIGNTLANTLLGNSGDNVLDGRANNDILRGGAGNDTYVVDSGGDVVAEAANQGTDTVQASVSYALTGSVENLTLSGAGSIDGTGNELDNTLRGNGSDNALDGGLGNGTLDGMLGNDTLTGGGDQDSFLFDTSLSAFSNVDTVVDFDTADDSLWLDSQLGGQFPQSLPQPVT